MNTRLSRRSVLLRALQLPVGGSVLLALAGCETEGEAALVCADPKKMTSAEESVRRSLQYAEASPYPDKSCSRCEFFKAAADGGGCGGCEIFGGNPVNPEGHCDSWSFDS